MKARGEKKYTTVDAVLEERVNALDKSFLYRSINVWIGRSCALSSTRNTSSVVNYFASPAPS